MPASQDFAATPALEAAARRDIRDLPGPGGWPLVGNMLQFDLPRLHLQFERWAERHGSPYRLRFAGKDILVVADAEPIATALRDRPDTWRRLRPIESVIREMGGHGVFSAEGEDWKRQRRLVMGAFDPAHLRRFFPSLLRVTERLAARFREAARSGEPVDLQATLMRYTVDVTAGLAFGADVNTLQTPHDPLQAHLDKLFPMMFRRINLPWPYWRYLRLPGDRAFDRHLAEVHVAIRGFIQAARQRLHGDSSLREHPTNLLEAMLAVRDADGDALSEEEIAGNVLTVLLAGEDTTANTLAWALHLLHTHPAVWRELVAEVDATLGEEAMPQRFEVARGFGFLEACVQETMRLRPVAPLLFFEANRDTALAGCRVPAGTGLFCLMRRAATGHALGADAASFRPARWHEAADDGSAQGRVLHKASMPFGAGPRLCPGRYLALLEMKMVLATLARNFDLLEVATRGGEPPEERIAFTMFPVGLRMRLAERRRR
jgi:cytochrome P450